MLRRSSIMPGKHHKRYFWIYFLAMAIGCNWPAFAKSDASFDNQSKETIETGVLEKNLLIMPQLNKLNFGFGRYKRIEYFYEKTISKVFFQDKPIEARVVGAVIEGSDVALELAHPILGTGTVKFFFSKELLKQASNEDIQKILRH